MTNVFFMVFMRKGISRIWIFLVLKLRQKKFNNLGQNPKVAVIIPLSRLFLQLVTPKIIITIQRLVLSPFLFFRNLIDCNKVHIRTKWNLLKTRLSVEQPLASPGSVNDKYPEHGVSWMVHKVNILKLFIIGKLWSKSTRPNFGRVWEGPASQPQSTLSCWKNLPPLIQNSDPP